jgi:hypothetical protein
MELSFLNRCHRFRGFVCQHTHFRAGKKSIEVALRPRKGSAAVWSRCHLPVPGYNQTRRILLTNLCFFAPGLGPQVKMLYGDRPV